MRVEGPSGTLAAEGLRKSYGPQLVIAEASLVVAPRTRLGVVGPNGIGKSTLLRLLAGLEAPDEGRVVRSPRSLEVGYLPQEAPSEGDETLGAFLRRRTGVAAAEARLDRLTAEMADDPDEAERYAEALDAFLALGGDDLDTRATALCEELGLGDAFPDRPLEAFSGGQRSRAQLAAILLARFGVFLLDEPTNDLDFEGLDRLEGFCRSLRAGLVVVSHDRAFLERTVDEICELEAGTRRGVVYRGGFREYLRTREEERRQRYAAYERYVGERDGLAEQARRIRSWSEKGVARQKRRPDDGNKVARDAKIAGAEKGAAKAKQIERRIERLDPVDKPWEPWELRLSLDPQSRAGRLVLRLEEVVVELGAFRLGPVSLEIDWGERVAITGPNGSGKTTLLHCAVGDLDPSSGSRWAGPSVVIGRMEQGRSRFSGDAPLVDAFVGAVDLVGEEARTLLAKFGLGADHVVRPCATLSPGERTRAVLAAFMHRGVNCLVLDEPTNHLDLPGIEELERALETYEGTLLVVSHDRRFLDALDVTRRIRIEEGRVADDGPA